MILPSEELELNIYRFAESAGKAMWRPTDLPTLSNIAQFHEHAVLVDALLDLQSRKLMEFRQWSNERRDWVLCTGDNRNYFYRAFEIRVTFPGRKYFERLEAQTAEPGRTAPTQDERLKEREAAAEGITALQAVNASSPQKVFLPESRNPRAFVSHATQDRPFVDRFAKDLWAVGASQQMLFEGCKLGFGSDHAQVVALQIVVVNVVHSQIVVRPVEILKNLRYYLKQTTPRAMAACCLGVSDLPHGERKPEIHCCVVVPNHVAEGQSLWHTRE
jgi:hypothetical protein